jgi:hypothetical protein
MENLRGGQPAAPPRPTVRPRAPGAADLSPARAQRAAERCCAPTRSLCSGPSPDPPRGHRRPPSAARALGACSRCFVPASSPSLCASCERFAALPANDSRPLSLGAPFSQVALQLSSRLSVAPAPGAPAEVTLSMPAAPGSDAVRGRDQARGEPRAALALRFASPPEAAAWAATLARAAAALPAAPDTPGPAASHRPASASAPPATGGVRGAPPSLPLAPSMAPTASVTPAPSTVLASAFAPSWASAGTGCKSHTPAAV